MDVLKINKWDTLKNIRAAYYEFILPSPSKQQSFGTVRPGRVHVR